eukprot:6490383-Amphidinium_carterae.1
MSVMDELGSMTDSEVPYISDMLDKHSEYVPLKVSKQPAQAESFGDMEVDQKELTEEQVNGMRAALGAVLWIVSRTRLDLAWSHSMCATALSARPSECLKRLRQLFGYLSENNNVGLRMTPSRTELSVYTDISFAPGGKSHAGLLLQFGG